MLGPNTNWPPPSAAAHSSLHNGAAEPSPPSTPSGGGTTSTITHSIATATMTSSGEPPTATTSSRRRFGSSPALLLRRHSAVAAIDEEEEELYAATAALPQQRVRRSAAAAAADPNNNTASADDPLMQLLRLSDQPSASAASIDEDDEDVFTTQVPAKPNDSSASPSAALLPLKCILLCEFHATAGPTIAAQVPDSYITKDVFAIVNRYIIPKLQLERSFLSVNLLGHKILGYPVRIDNPLLYARNAFYFNVCFVFEPSTRTVCYEPVVRKLTEYMVSELERAGSGSGARVFELSYVHIQGVPLTGSRFAQSIDILSFFFTFKFISSNLRSGERESILRQK